MKVIGIVGSPRKNGNTNILVQQVLSGAAEAGAETGNFILNELDYKGCQGCGYCKTHDGCRLEDDLMKVFDELAEADGIVFGSPIYFAQFTGQMRLFLDRCYSLVNPDYSSRLAAGKKVVLVGAQGMPEASAYSGVFEEFAGELNRFLGLEVKQTLIAAGSQTPGDVKENAELMEEARNTGLTFLK